MTTEIKTPSPWLDPTMPQRQYEMIVQRELAAFRKGYDVLPYNAVLKCLKRLPAMDNPTLLDIGASSGYYSEVLKLGNFSCRYTALDWSHAYKAFAEKLYPGIDFHVGNACELPFADESFDIAFSGCCLLHIPGYDTAIRETARVAKKYALFSKTPVHDGPTEFYEKEAYGLPHCFEIRFNEYELMTLFVDNGLEMLWTEPAGAGHKTYLLRKLSLSEREWEQLRNSHAWPMDSRTARRCHEIL